jgi:hypothetical protein
MKIETVNNIAFYNTLQEFNVKAKTLKKTDSLELSIDKSEDFVKDLKFKGFKTYTSFGTLVVQN